MDIFEYATKNKLRFHTSKGIHTVEDVWALPLTGAISLNELAKSINNALKSSEENFVELPTTPNKAMQVRFDIVKHIIADKLARREAQAKLAENKAKKEQILSLIADKQNTELANKPIEELLKMVKDL